MTFDDTFLDDIIEDIALLRTRLMNRLRGMQEDLHTMRKSGNPLVHHQEFIDIVEQMDSARIHLYVAGEYLRGNGEWCLLQDEEEELAAYVS
jgi:hypothetical protein